MNGSRDSVAALLAGVAAGVDGGCDVAVCPPVLFLDLCVSRLAETGIAVGAQDVSEHDAGAYTGEVAATMLAEAGARYVLVGHSERRSYHRESDAAIARKTRSALRAGLTPIVCVGETQEEREAGDTDAVLVRQVGAVVDGLGSAELQRIVIAYEPVWAIGTGLTATPEMAQDAHATIRRCVAGYCPDSAARVKILYGGSMKPASAAGLLAMPDIDGGLIGGASLNAQDFLAVVAAAA